MARQIKHRAQCFYCKEWFEKGQALLQRMNGRWYCQCYTCYRKRKAVEVEGE